MKRCLACACCFENDTWECPQCRYRPISQNEALCFTETPADNGFKPEYFAKLASIEQAHFWFRVRNKLIQWALGNYFPDAKSFFEVGCGTGFVLAGIRETFPGIAARGQRHFHRWTRLCQSTFTGRGFVSDGCAINSV